MTAPLQCKFFIIRYVVDLVRGEFVNIGVLLEEIKADRTVRREIRLTKNWERVRSVNSDIDLVVLNSLENEMAVLTRDVPGHSASRKSDITSLRSDIERSFPNTIQLTEPSACLAEDFDLELDRLMRLYVESRDVGLNQILVGRAAIAAEIRKAFEGSGVWQHMHKDIAASLYTRPGDPLKLDCGYRAGTGTKNDRRKGAIRIFQAVSLNADLASAQALAYSVTYLREGFLRLEGAILELTAVVEVPKPVFGLDQIEGNESDTAAMNCYRFGIAVMESAQIRVLTTRDLARAAESARIELNL